jgi:predicted lactoylglutathione lyase
MGVKKMIGYVTLGSNDLEATANFYDSLLEVIGARRMTEEDSFVAWATIPVAPSIAATRPFDGQPATVGNGVMVALAVDSPELVNKLHARAIELGGVDEGAPGPRGE